MQEIIKVLEDKYGASIADIVGEDQVTIQDPITAVSWNGKSATAYTFKDAAGKFHAVLLPNIPFAFVERQ